MILQNGDMVITIPKEEKGQQLKHLNDLIPADDIQYNEISVLINMVEGKPTLTLIKVGKHVG